MSEHVTVSPEDLDKAVAVARTLERADAFGALCYDVLSRQAEGRSLFSGKKFVNGRGQAHDVTRAGAETPFGNLLTLLERGPESSMQWAFVAALFVHGFERAVQAQPEQRKALVAKLAAHCDFFELSTPYRVRPLLASMRDPELASEVHEALGALVLRDDAQTAEPETRARNAGRIAGLAEANTPAAHAALERIEATARDPYSAALAALALGKTSGSIAPGCEVQGRLRRLPGGLFSTIVRWVSGWALLSWVLQLLLSVVGYRCEVALDLGGDAVRVRRRTFLLGRMAHDVQQVHPLGRLASARRSARYPMLHLLLGVFCFALGILLGGVFAFDAARTGDRALFSIAGALVLLGSGLDLVLEVLIPGGRGRVLLDLDFGRRHRLCLSGVSIEDADRFLRELWRKLSRPPGGRRAVA